MGSSSIISETLKNQGCLKKYVEIKAECERLLNIGLSKLVSRRILTNIRVNPFNPDYFGISSRGIGVYRRIGENRTTNIHTLKFIEDLKQIDQEDLIDEIPEKNRGRFEYSIKAIEDFKLPPEISLEVNRRIESCSKNTKIERISINSSGDISLNISMLGLARIEPDRRQKFNVSTTIARRINNWYRINSINQKVLGSFEEDIKRASQIFRDNIDKINEWNSSVLDKLEDNIGSYILMESL